MEKSSPDIHRFSAVVIVPLAERCFSRPVAVWLAHADEVSHQLISPEAEVLSNVTNLCASDFHEPVLGSRRPTAVNLWAPGPWPRGPWPRGPGAGGLGAGGLGGIIARCLGGIIARCLGGIIARCLGGIVGGIVVRISFFTRTSVVIARLSCGE